MGDLAEGKFEQWAAEKKVKYVRYGLNRPPFRKISDLPALISGTPDYLCDKDRKFLTEVKGCGARVVKLKLDSMNVLHEWNSILEVWVFIYNSGKDAWTMVPYVELEEITKLCKVKEFDTDHKEYYEIPVKHFTWQEFKENTDGKRQESIGY